MAGWNRPTRTEHLKQGTHVDVVALAVVGEDEVFELHFHLLPLLLFCSYKFVCVGYIHAVVGQST